MSWTDKPCYFSPSHAPHLWGEEVETHGTPFVYLTKTTFRCDGVGRYDPDE